MFIASSTRELLPAVSVQGLKIRAAHQVRDRLQKAFTAYVQTYVAPRKRADIIA
jgi:hypothetical protein